MTDCSGSKVAKLDVCSGGAGGERMNNALFFDVEYLRLLNIHETRETFRRYNVDLREATFFYS